VSARTPGGEDAPARAVFHRGWLNALQRMGVVKVGQARALSEERLWEIPNVGPKTVAEITAALADPGTRLGGFD
jgi:DNA-directed RNA polymerase alpha subunit